MEALFNLGAWCFYKWNSQVFFFCVWPFCLKEKKNAEIPRQYHWFFHEITSEKQAQKLHTDDVLKPISYTAITNQKQPHLGSDTSSEWNFCVRFSDVVSQRNQWWRHEISAVFSGCVAFCTFAVLATFFVFFFFSFWFLFYHKLSLRKDSV